MRLGPAAQRQLGQLKAIEVLPPGARAAERAPGLEVGPRECAWRSRAAAHLASVFSVHHGDVHLSLAQLRLPRSVCSQAHPLVLEPVSAGEWALE